MRFNEVNYILEVANLRSINKAAQKLFISQSTLSNIIKKIEDDLDIVIFKRTHRGVELTEAGKKFIQYSKNIIQQINNIHSIPAQDAEALSLRISTFPSYHVLTVFTEIYNRYFNANMRFLLKEANDFAVIQDVVNKNSDIGVVSFTNLNEGCWNNILKRGELVFHEISENKLHIIVGQKNPLYDSEEVNIEDLAHFPMIFLSHDYNKWTHEEANVLGLNDNPLMTQVSSRDLLIKTVAPTMGVAFGLRPFNSAVSEYYSYQQIKSIPCNIPNFYIKVGYIKQDTSTAVVNEFISLLEQSYS